MHTSSTRRPLRRYQGRPPAGMLAVAALAVAFSASSAWARVTSEATTSRAAHDEAVAAIPFEQLTPTTQQKLRDVVSHPSMYRRMPVKLIACDADMYVFLVRYPEVVVNVWRLMGITNVNAKRTGDYTLTTSDGAGTASNIELVYGTRDKHVLYATATYTGSLTRRPVKARCVMLLRSGYMQTEQGRCYVASQLDVFVRFDHLMADLAVRTLQHWLGKTADYNFTESIGFLQQISSASETNLYGVRRLAARLTQVDSEVRSYFTKLAEEASRKSAENLRQSPPVATAPAADPAAGPVVQPRASVAGGTPSPPR